MARSLNGGTADKPVVPLRFRINPKLKQLEELESLERELNASGLKHKNIDLYNDLLEDLKVRRAKVMPEKPLTKEEQAKKKAQEEASRYEAMPFEPNPDKWRMLRYRASSGISDKVCGWILFLIVLVWLYCRNK